MDTANPIFLHDGDITMDENVQYSHVLANYKAFCNKGNLPFIGVCKKHSRDKYWENYNVSFAEFCKSDTESERGKQRFEWFQKKKNSYRMIPPSLKMSYMSFSKYDRPQYEYDREAMALAHEWTKRHFMPSCVGSKVMSYDEVYLELVKNTSTGYPFGMKWPIKKLIPPVVCREICDFYWEDLSADSISYVPIWTCSQKREMRSAAKIEEHKIRTFTAASFEQTICMNRLCLDMNSKFYAGHLKSWSFVGGTKFLGGWQRLYDHLNCGGKFPLAYELDETNYDCSLLQDLMYGQVDIRWDYLHSQYKTEVNRRRLQRLYDNAIFALVVMEDGALLQKLTGNPSGSTNTIVDNTMILYKLFAYAFILLAPEKLCTYKYFTENVRAALNGDDNTFTTTEALRDWFNPKTIKEVWDKIGVITKTPSFEPRKLEEVEFLSQRFVRKNGIWCPSPDTDKVLCSLLWASKKEDVRWHFLRACMLRMDSWANDECNNILTDYIEHILTSVWRKQMNGIIEGIPIEDIFDLWRSEKWCWALYSGYENLLVEVGSGNTRLLYKNFLNSIDFSNYYF